MASTDLVVAGTAERTQEARLQAVRQLSEYSSVRRALKSDLDELRASVLQTMIESEPDLELVDWEVPVLTSATDDGPQCPECGTSMTFVSFIRIRPPRLQWRSAN